MKSSGKEYVTICVTTTDRRVHDTYPLAHACGQFLGILVTLGSPAWSWEKSGKETLLLLLSCLLFCFVLFEGLALSKYYFLL